MQWDISLSCNIHMLRTYRPTERSRFQRHLVYLVVVFRVFAWILSLHLTNRIEHCGLLIQRSIDHVESILISYLDKNDGCHINATTDYNIISLDCTAWFNIKIGRWPLVYVVLLFGLTFGSKYWIVLRGCVSYCHFPTRAEIEILWVFNLRFLASWGTGAYPSPGVWQQLSWIFIQNGCWQNWAVCVVAVGLDGWLRFLDWSPGSGRSVVAPVSELTC